MGEKKIVSISSTLFPRLWVIRSISLTKGLPILVCVLCFYEISVLHGYSCVFINGKMFHFGRLVMICHWLVCSC